MTERSEISDLYTVLVYAMNRLEQLGEDLAPSGLSNTLFGKTAEVRWDNDTDTWKLDSE